MRESNIPRFGPLEGRIYIDHKVREMAKSLRENSGQKHSLRFDPYSCAMSLGLTVTEIDLPPGVSGRLRVDLPIQTIEIRRGDNRLRRRYTASHELAHLCFLKDVPAYPRERGD